MALCVSLCCRSAIGATFTDSKLWLFSTNSSVNTKVGLVLVPELTQYLFVRPGSGRARIYYEAVTTPEAYADAVLRYGNAVQSGAVHVLHSAVRACPDFCVRGIA